MFWMFFFVEVNGSVWNVIYSKFNCWGFDIGCKLLYEPVTHPDIKYLPRTGAHSEVLYTVSHCPTIGKSVPVYLLTRKFDTIKINVQLQELYSMRSSVKFISRPCTHTLTFNKLERIALPDMRRSYWSIAQLYAHVNKCSYAKHRLCYYFDIVHPKKHGLKGFTNSSKNTTIDLQEVKSVMMRVQIAMMRI